MSAGQDKNNNEQPQTPPVSTPKSSDNDPNTVVGVLIKQDGVWKVKPCNKKKMGVYTPVDITAFPNAKENDVLVTKRVHHAKGDPGLKATRILGHKDDQAMLSLISFYEKGLTEDFTAAATKETESMSVPELGDREDLRQVPLVTVDGKDTRDFDDAIFAEPTKDGGYHMIVAIADVSFYVRPGTALDEEAYLRGNSTYFPDRAFPMLPEELSNGLCSLKPHEDRACLAFHLYIDKDGQMTDYKITRALMNSAARLTYEQLQDAKDGHPDKVTKPLMKNVVTPLYDAYALLRKAREERGAIDMDMPEQKVLLDKDGNAAGIVKRERHDSCRVIEEFMILANVAAASALEDKAAPCVYRSHEPPPNAGRRMGALRSFLSEHGIALPEVIDHPSIFRDVIEKVKGTPHADAVTKAILSVQAKAMYTPDNKGHFGLALIRYAHFTSPIRRYADLIVHRSLVSAFNLGAGGLDDAQKEKFPEQTQHISGTDGTSDKAQRSAQDRFAVASMKHKVGTEDDGVITGIARQGLFVRIPGAPIDGVIPRENLPADFYEISGDNNELRGRHHGRVYRRGDTLKVRLKMADALAANLVFTPVNDNVAKAVPQAKPQHKRDKGPRK